MMEALWRVGVWFWNNLSSLVMNVFHFMANIHKFIFVQVLMMIGIVFQLFKFFLGLVSHLQIFWERYLTSGQAADFDALPDLSGLMTTLEVCNYIFPVAELITYITLYLSFWVTGTTYRFIKSWLPTLS